MRVGWSSVQAAGRIQNQERNDECGNQRYSRELLVMGIVVPETS